MSGNHRSRLAGVVTLLIAAALIAVMARFLFTSTFQVKNIIVEGNTEKSVSEIAAIAGVDYGDPIFSVDENDMWEKLAASGALEVTDVRRELPDTLYIAVNDRKERALALIGGRVAVIDSDGYVTRLVNYEPITPSLYVSGTGATKAEKGSLLNAKSDRLEAMRAVLEGLYARNAQDRIKDINVSDVSAIFLTTSNGMRVEFGDAQNADTKIALMIASLNDLETRGSYHGTLDVSNSEKAYYTPGV